MSARRFRVTQTVLPTHELLGDWVARHFKPIARVLRVPADCPGCAARRKWLNRLDRRYRAWFR
jgi:hypothetical protein